MQIRLAVGLRSLAVAGLAGVILTLGAGGHNALAAGPVDGTGGPADDSPETINVRAAYLDAHPGVKIIESDGTARLAGAPLAFGPSAQIAADTAVADAAALFGAVAADLVAGAEHLPAGQGSLPLMFDAATGQYKFTAVYYQQVRDGVPVYGSRVTALVRNEANNPVVLLNPDVRDLGNFQVAAAKNPNVISAAGKRNAKAMAGGAASQILSSRRVIFAGMPGKPAPAALADEMVLANGAEKWRVITDANTGQVLFEEFLIHFGTVNGNVSGNASDGPAIADCEPEISKPLPYATVTNGVQSVFTDVNGDFTSTFSGGTFTMLLKGMWFDVFNEAGADMQETVAGATPANVLFGSAGATEQEQAQINAYVEANLVRDFVLQFNPAYPTLSNVDFPVHVNRTDGFCPQNAWYDPADQSINFCLSSGASVPNTAWSSVIHHEYGHHLVNAAGSGQGQYGEGAGDCMSLLILDDNRLGLGFFGDCNGPLRNADNTMQYPCSDAIHTCGQLISGCVWDTRNELILTNPGNYIDILANLFVNSMLVHSGSSITPQIAIDFLTLDDDNGNLDDGTPHFAEIAEGFRVHNMLPPEVSTVRINLPNGLASFANPDGSTTIQIEALALDGTIVPNSTVMWVDTGSGFQSSVMTSVGGDLYEGTFPMSDCGTAVDYYFVTQSTSGLSADSPDGAPVSSHTVISAYSEGTTSFDDDFESNLGWSVSGGATDGQWDRGVPADGSRGDPSADADGSGQCFVTDNVAGNSDVDGGATTLTSPVMDATGGGFTISYWRWFSNDTGDGPNSDPFTVEINDGSGWQALEVVGPAGTGTSGGWFNAQFTLDDVPGFVQNNQFQIRFTAEDTDPGSIVEAAVDGVELVQVDCTPPDTGCPGDIVANNAIDVFDLLELLENWGTGGAGADIAPPTNVVDVFDLLALLEGWGSCP